MNALTNMIDGILGTDTASTSSSPRIYVASLSDYNNGRLHGAWIDLDGKDVDDVQAEIAAMLRNSKYPNVMVEDEETGEEVPSAEEWAIHDFDGFEGIKLEEFASLSEVVALANALNESDNPEAFAAYWQNSASDTTVEDAVDGFQDSFQGIYDTKIDFAQQLLDDTGELESIPEHLRNYFDYESYARDLFIDGYWCERISDGLAVFSDR